MQNQIGKIQEKREVDDHTFSFEEMFNISFDKMSNSVKDTFHFLDKEDQKTLVQKLIDVMDKDNDATKILIELLNEMSDKSEKHSKKEENKEFVVFREDEELTVNQVLKAYTKVKSINTVKNHVKGNKLIGYVDSGVFKLPAWQFNNGGPLPNLERVIASIGSNGVIAVRTLETPIERFDGKKGYEFLRDGDLETVNKIIKLTMGFSNDEQFR